MAGASGTGREGAARVRREMEGRDEAARPDRDTLPYPLIAFRPGRDVERLDLPRHPHAFLGGDAECVDQPRDLAFRIADRLARLDAEREGELVEALAGARDAMAEHVLPLGGGPPRRPPRGPA